MPFLKRWDPEVVAAVGRLALSTDRPLKDIAREAGVPIRTVSFWNREYGWRAPLAGHASVAQWQGDPAGADLAVLLAGAPGSPEAAEP